jgi:hypothetical protein
VFGPYDGSAPRGTLFVNPTSPHFEVAKAEFAAPNKAPDADAREKASSAKAEARKLLSLDYDARRGILNAIADALVDEANVAEILEENAKDLDDAAKSSVDAALVRRLKLSLDKLKTLSSGIAQIASCDDPLGVVKKELEVADGLELTQLTVPIGVLLVIFESRPDSLPQIAALSIASGNGLLLKGGKEAAYSNKCLHRIIGNAIESASGGEVGRDLIGLVQSRNEIASLLGLDDCIDLGIPRGGNALVSHIKANTKIPVRACERSERASKASAKEAVARRRAWRQRRRVRGKGRHARRARVMRSRTPYAIVARAYAMFTSPSSPIPYRRSSATPTGSATASSTRQPTSTRRSRSWWTERRTTPRPATPSRRCSCTRTPSSTGSPRRSCRG